MVGCTVLIAARFLSTVSRLVVGVLTLRALSDVLKNVTLNLHASIISNVVSLNQTVEVVVRCRWIRTSSSAMNLLLINHPTVL